MQLILRLIIILLYSNIVCAELLIDNKFIEAIKTSIKEEMVLQHVFNNNDRHINISLDRTKLKQLTHYGIDYVIGTKIQEVNKRNNYFKGFVIFMVGNKRFTASISGRFTEMVKIPVLQSRTIRGSIISTQDIDFMLIDNRKINNETVMSSKEMVGKMLKQSIAPHTPVKISSLRSPIVIKKKQLVNILYQNNHIEIRTVAMALEDGAVGETIRLKNPKSNVIVQGMITDNKLVKVY